MVRTLYVQVAFAAIALLTTLVVPRVKVLLTIAGVSRTRNGAVMAPKNLGTCKAMHGNTLRGCEDMHLVVDGDTRVLFLACSADVMDRVGWFPGMGHVSPPSHVIHDKFFAWDLVRDEVTELRVGAGGPTEFASHGMDVVLTRPGEVAVYAINHRTHGGSVVEKYTHTIGSSQMQHVKTFDDQEVVYTPNDIYVADEADDFFYVTNDHRFRVGLPRRLETILQLPTTHLAVHSNTLGGYKIARSGLMNLNGLAGDRKGMLIANSVAAAVYVFDYKRDGNVTLVQHLKVNHGIDNPTYSSETNELLVTGFPTALELEEFTRHPHEDSAASAVTRMSLTEIGSKFVGGSDTTSRFNPIQPALDEFFLDPGTGVMNMSTTTVVDKAGDAWYITSVFGFAVVKCTGYSKTYVAMEE